MHPSPPSTLPARALRTWRTAVPVLVTGCLVATGIVAVNAMGAAAAAGDTVTIGADPIALTQPTDPGTGALTPTGDAAERGMFGPQVDWPIIPMHAAVARNGHLVTFGTPLGSGAQAGLVYDDWDPTAGTDPAAHGDTMSMHDYDSFCNALVELADGRLLMVGGNSTTSSMIYDPISKAQVMGQQLAQQRWYATTMRLADGRVLVLGGGNYYNTGAFLTPDDDSGVATTPEIGSGTDAWTRLTGATSSAAFGARANRWWYPRAFNGPDGDVVGFSGDQLWRLSTAGAGTTTMTGTLPFNPGVSGSEVMYAPGKVLVAGGGQIANGDTNAATTAAAVVDFTTPTPSVTTTSAMANARNWLNLTVLPDGEVFANGGTRVGTLDGAENNVGTSETWDPTTGAWRLSATSPRTRTYHSTSLLLPSGAVFTGGGGTPGPETNLNAELYYPSYLFTRGVDGVVRWADRPAITSIAGSATHGGTVDLGVSGGTMASASLISLPSVTHSQNTDQRRVPLQVTQSGATLHATLPASANTLPAGDYELTVVNAEGVPSAAQIITIRNGAAGAVTIAAAAAAGAPAGAPAPASSAPAGAPVPDPVASSGTPARPAAGSDAVRLTRGATIGLDPVASSGLRVSHSKSTVSVRKVGSKSSAAARRASSWIVRTGLGSRAGYSFESVDRPGWYLVAAKTEGGRVTLAKRSKSASYTSRATFSAVRGVMGHDISLRLTTKPDRVLRTSGSKLIAGSVGESPARLMAATFTLPKGLAARR